MTPEDKASRPANRVMSDHDYFQFQAEFRRVYKRPSSGQYQHYCGEWDYMPIDSACLEFFCCTCFSDEDATFVKLRSIQQKRQNARRRSTP